MDQCRAQKLLSGRDMCELGDTDKLCHFKGCVTLKASPTQHNMATYGYDAKLDDTHHRHFLMQEKWVRRIFVACPDLSNVLPGVFLV